MMLIRIHSCCRRWDCDGVLTADDCDDTDAESTAVVDDADCDGVLTVEDCDDVDAESTVIADDEIAMVLYRQRIVMILTQNPQS